MFRQIALLLTLGGAILLVAPVAARAEVIREFTSTYTIQTDGTVKVQEVILYDFEAESRHGMYRLLENGHPQSATKSFRERYIDIAVTGVALDGQPVPYEVTDEGVVTVKIGDPETFVTGRHEYTINYVLSGALSYGSEGAEFYYNVTGNGWEAPIEQVTAVVTGAEPGLLKEKSFCYAGRVGSTAECVEKTQTATSTTFKTTGLAPSEGLTVAQQVDGERVARLVVERSSLGWILWVVAALWSFGFLVYGVYFHFKNKIDRPVIAQYEPYAGLLPMYTGVLFDNSLDPRDITAGIVYLAEQGFITIKRTERKVLWVFDTTEYELTLKRPLSEVPNSFLEQVLMLLFGTSPALEQVVPLSELARRRNKNAAIVRTLSQSLLKDLETKGFFDKQLKYVVRTAAKWFLIVWGLSFAALLAGGVLESRGLAEIVPPVTFALALTAVYVGVATHNRRSQKGYEALNHLEGFKLFLSVTDKERFDFHNAPEKSPELFMKYLPYAIALGVEEKWARVFEDITIPNPDWYDGGSLAAFSAVSFTKDVSAFSTTFASSSGTSGSSGGGSSGGGGGGGGGGSW